MRLTVLVPCLIAAAAALVPGCTTAPPPAQAGKATPAPEEPAGLQTELRRESTASFYRGKAYALSGDADCARVEFDRALEAFREASRPGNTDDLEFGRKLYEGIANYDSLLGQAPDQPEERPTGVPAREGLIASAPVSNAEEIAAADREVAASRSEATFDVPIVVNEPVLRAVAFFQFRTPKAFAAALQRSGRYLPLMRSLLRERGLPEDLVYIAMIESAFKSTAHSKAAAHGYWQFISGTAKRYNLQMTRELDERSDPVKATLAAASYFSDLYEMFGDWQLAMAGYSCGEGRVLRELQRTGLRTYWELSAGGYLPRETRDYVPFFTAAALISKSPARYGFDVVPDPPISFDVVSIAKPLDLGRIAAAVGSSVDELRGLNGELKGRVTPRSVSPYPLRVPKGQGPVLEARLTALPSAPEVEERRVAARKGDTLARVASRYGVAVAELADWNDLPRDAKLKKGTVLTIPVKRRSSPAAPRPQPVAAQLEASAASVPGQVRALPTPAAAVTDTASLLARYPDARADSGAAQNGAAPKRVEIPAEGFEAAPRARTSSAARKSPAPAKTVRAASKVHTVRRGETLATIAARYGTSVDALQTKNHLRSGEPLRAGRKLTVPASLAR